MAGSSNRYRADQVGSFLRSDELKQARADHQQGSLPLERLREVEDREILRVLQMQQQVGIDVLSDGEFRRGGWASDFQEAVAGYVPGEPPVVMSWHSSGGGGAATAEAEAPARAGAGLVSRVIGDKLQQRRRLTGHESAFLRQHAAGQFVPGEEGHVGSTNQTAEQAHRTIHPGGDAQIVLFGEVPDSA